MSELEEQSQMNKFYSYSMLELEECEAHYEHMLALIREARRELINKTNTNKQLD